MTIVKKSNMVSFDHISCGEVFKDERSNYCMKIECDDDKNLVCLSDGVLGYADDNEMFERVTCHLAVSN